MARSSLRETIRMKAEQMAQVAVPQRYEKRPGSAACREPGIAIVFAYFIEFDRVRLPCEASLFPYRSWLFSIVLEFTARVRADERDVFRSRRIDLPAL